MTAIPSRPQSVDVETITDSMAAFVQYTGDLVRQQDEILESARGMISGELATSVTEAISEAAKLNAREFNSMIGALAGIGFGIGVRDTNDLLLPIQELTFDDRVNKYSLQCTWQNETHAVIFDDSLSFIALQARTRHVARPVA